MKSFEIAKPEWLFMEINGIQYQIKMSFLDVEKFCLNFQKDLGEIDAGGTDYEKVEYVFRSALDFLTEAFGRDALLDITGGNPVTPLFLTEMIAAVSQAVAEDVKEYGAQFDGNAVEFGE